MVWIFSVDSVFFLDIPMDVAIERLTQRTLDPVTGDRFHAHDHPPPTQEIHQRSARHPVDDDEAVQKRYQNYTVYYDEIQDYYAQIDAVHIPADQDAYTVFEAVEAGIVNQLSKDES